jgi:transcriptional regulator with XRE-family HTH domain
MNTDGDIDVSVTKAPHESDEPTRGVRWEELSGLIRAKRAAERLTLYQAARESGVSAATLSRWERRRSAGAGQPRGGPQPEPDTRTLAATARWLGVSLDQIVTVSSAQSDQCVMHRDGDSTPDVVAAHLRADRNLNAATAKALESMFRVAYEQFANIRAAPATERAEASSRTEPESIDTGSAKRPSDID